jgi:hypothetical protein
MLTAAATASNDSSAAIVSVTDNLHGFTKKGWPRASSPLARWPVSWGVGPLMSPLKASNFCPGLRSSPLPMARRAPGHRYSGYGPREGGYLSEPGYRQFRRDRRGVHGTAW